MLGVTPGKFVSMTIVMAGSNVLFRLLEYQACENLSREIMEQLHARNKERPGTMSYDLLSGKIRVRLRQHGNEVNQLRDKLQLPSVVSHLYPFKKPYQRCIFLISS